MIEIVKNCDDDLFEKILSGEKKFELRLADDEYNIGDVIVLKEIGKHSRKLTGREIKKKITFMLKTKNLDFWSKDDIDKFGFVVLSLE